MTWLLNAVLNWALGALTKWLGGLLRFWNRNKQIDKEAEESKIPLEKAKTEKEIDEAAKDILGGL